MRGTDIESLKAGSYEYFRAKWRTWGLRFYAAAFITFGLLALQLALRHHATLHLIVWVLICIVGASAMTMGITSYIYAIRFRLVRRREGGR